VDEFIAARRRRTPGCCTDR